MVSAVSSVGAAEDPAPGGSGSKPGIWAVGATWASRTGECLPRHLCLWPR